MAFAEEPTDTVSWRHRPWVMVWPIALTQLISWGCIYYSFAIFIVPLETHFGWSKQAINLALTLALLVLALSTYPLARYLDRHGGLLPMTAAAALAAVLLFGLALIESYAAFVLLWIALGVCMSALLYEPAFLVVTQVFKGKAREGITAVTLVAGFSSTVFIPLTEYVLQTFGWRATYTILGVIMLLVVMPLHYVFIPPREHTPSDANRKETNFNISRLLEDPVYWGLALWASAHSFMLVGLFFQLVPWLKAEGVAAGAIVIAIAVMGPMQVVGRVLMMLFGKRLSLAIIGVITAAMFPAAIGLLIYAEKTLAMLCLAIGVFGMANGITTILRGAIPAEWFTPDHYAKIAGAIAVPAITAGALAPFVLALVWESRGAPAMLGLACGVAAFSLTAFVFAWLSYRGK